MLKSSIIDVKEHRETTLVRQEGGWGATKRFFGGIFGGDDWGYDEKVTIRKEFLINIEQLKGKVKKEIDLFLKRTEIEIENNIQKPIQDGVNEFFTQYMKIFNQVNADLKKGLKDKEKSKQAQDALSNKIIELNAPTKGIVRDSKDLSSNISGLFIQ
jgi:hypothetical protein